MPSHNERVFLATAGGLRAEATLRELLRDESDLGGVIALAAAEGVAGSVARLLRGVGGIVLDEATTAQLKELERAPEFRMRFFEQRLRDTLRRLDVAGMDVLVTGRAALGFAGYASFAEMALEEAVLEVRRVREVQEVLNEAGFLPNPPNPPDPPNPPNLVVSDSTAPAMNVRLRLRPASDLWSRAEHVLGLPPRVRIPSRVDRMVEACRQQPGWRAVRDVAVIVGTEPFDWAALPRDRALFAVLRLARDYADVAVPDALLAELRPPWWRRLF